MSGIPSNVHYRKADTPGERCDTCIYYFDGDCAMFNAHVGASMVCDEWAGSVEKEAPLYTADAVHRPLEGIDMLRMSQMFNSLEPTMKADTKAAGIAVRAADTGRVLMIQRSLSAEDPASGSWEFPGGVLAEGEHPYPGAKREWQEETGMRLPRGRHVGEWRSGVYHGFVHEVRNEKNVKINMNPDDRRVMNPDDPDGDQIEVAAWWHPHQLKRMSSLRDELRFSRPWQKLAKAQGALYLISHAKTRYNKPGAPHDIVQGWRNIPIDATGRRQANKLGQFLKDKGVDELYASDLQRGKQTASIAGRVAGLSPKLDQKFRPWNLGTFAGHSSADVIPKLKPFMDDHPDEPVDGGESFNEYKQRFIPALEKLLKRAQSGKTVALVTHSRNIELAEGWVGGSGYRQKVDTKAIEADTIQPASIYEVAPNRAGKFVLKELDGIGKEAAPGPAGNIPPPGDQSNMMQMPDDAVLAGVGPTLQNVHVNRPLKNISVSYVGRNRRLRVKKADQKKQLIYGVVLEPNVLDSQDDYMYPDQVEKAAHGYMKRVARGKATVSKIQHSRKSFFKEKPSVVPVESFIAPCDFTYDGNEMVKKGTWVMALHIEDPKIWGDVLDGKYTGLSIGGTGIRQSVSIPSDVPPRVPGEWMVGEPSWAGDQGVFAKQASPADFSRWRDYGWEGSGGD